MTEEHFISAIIVWLMAVVIKSFIHFYIIEVNKIDPHKSAQVKILNWLLTGMASILHAILFDVQDFPEYFVILFFQVMWHQVIFAPLKNKLRGKGYFYLGLASGGFDKYFVKRPAQYRIFYFTYCALALTSIFLLRRLYP